MPQALQAKLLRVLQRELGNTLEYGFILCPGGLIHPEHLPEHILPATDWPADEPFRLPAMTMEAVKFRAVRDALARHAGKKMAACRELDISKDTLRRILARGQEGAQWGELPEVHRTLPLQGPDLDGRRSDDLPGTLC